MNRALDGGLIDSFIRGSDASIYSAEKDTGTVITRLSPFLSPGRQPKVLAIHVYTLWVFVHCRYRDECKALPVLYILNIILFTFPAPQVLENHHVPIL